MDKMEGIEKCLERMENVMTKVYTQVKTSSASPRVKVEEGSNPDEYIVSVTCSNITIAFHNCTPLVFYEDFYKIRSMELIPS